MSAARLPEEIERELWDRQREADALRDAARSLPQLSTYVRSNGRRFYASNVTESEDDAREIMERRRELNRELREHEAQIRALRAEYRRLTSAWPVGCEDLAAMLGVQLGTVHQWRKRGVLPEPAGMLGGAPWWWRTEILQWARNTKRVDRVMAEVA